MISSPPEQLDLQRLTAAIGPVCQRHAVARMQLFGSRATGQARDDSDFDFLVEFLPQANAGLFEMGGLKEDLEQQLGHPVDLLSRSAVERSRNPYRRRSILAAPVTVYAQ
ncbi:MAG: nucleotidyltransferase family protein [Prosthecobacter sp.]|uniref:nucleotidyltransferase family protein n=1 Tax=Prosthecobacter sp. TaxID=1965333 RepID=UPI0038FDFA33